jgi:DNA-binding NarL/FixJ family response regulator
MEKVIYIIIVDDHRLFRTGLRNTFQHGYPDISVVGEADCGKTLFTLPGLDTADLVLLDINLPDMNGADVARRLRSDYPGMKILAISGENDRQTVQTMIEAGIDGFISKQQGDGDELAQAIRSVAGGAEYFGRDIAAIIYDVFVAKRKSVVITPEFTGRERDIITLCRDGLIYKEVADRLGISVHTVNSHKKKIFQKLGINNTMEMVQYALKNGIIRIEN